MIEFVKPDEIEKRSFEIIRSELEVCGLSQNARARLSDPAFASVIMRVIHTTADFEYAETLEFSDGAVERAVTALRNGAAVVCDTNMVKAGADKQRLRAFGSDIFCFIGDEDVAENARQNGVTRAGAAVDKAVAMGKPVIYAVGNAPTALIRICELNETKAFAPEFVIGVPVGFVNAAESKELLIKSGIPHIAARGRKGGSNVAAAICNALLRIAAA